MDSFLASKMDSLSDTGLRACIVCWTLFHVVESAPWAIGAIFDCCVLSVAVFALFCFSAGIISAIQTAGIAVVRSGV